MSWFNTQAPKANLSGSQALLQTAFQPKKSILTSLSESMGELNQVIDTRAKETYSKGALESLKGAKSMQDIQSLGIDTSKLSDNAKQQYASSLDMIGRVAQEEQRNLSNQLAFADANMKGERFAMDVENVEYQKDQDIVNQTRQKEIDRVNKLNVLDQIRARNKPKEIEYSTIYDAKTGKDVIVPKGRAIELVNNGLATTIKPSSPTDKFGQKFYKRLEDGSIQTVVAKNQDDLRMLSSSDSGFIRGNVDRGKFEGKTDLQKKQDFADSKIKKIITDYNTTSKTENESIMNIDISDARKSKKISKNLDQAFIAEVESLKGVDAKNAIKDANEAVLTAQSLSKPADVYKDQLSKGNKINVLNQFWNSTVGVYVGKEIGTPEKLYSDKYLSGFMNKLRSDQFGAVLPKQDVQRFNESATSLYASYPDLIKGTTAMIEAQLDKVMLAKDTIGDRAFHIKYSPTVKALRQKIVSLKYAQGIMPEGKSVVKNGTVYTLINGKPTAIGKAK